jgi:manganese efflux pump family protein
MAKLLALALVLSFDSFLVSIALGTLGLGRPTKRNLVLLFAFCDSTASLSGGLLCSRFAGTESLWFGKLEGVVLCSYLLIMIPFVRYARSFTSNRRTASFLYALPFFLSLDNLAAGMSSSLPTVSLPVFAATVGLVSALAACIGLQLGSLARRRLPIRAVDFASVALLFFVATLQPL